MSKTKLRTDPAALVTVTFKREVATQSATTGEHVISFTTVAASVIGDLQPIVPTRGGGLARPGTGIEPEGDHVFMAQTRVSGVRVTDVLDTGDGRRFRVSFIADMVSTPQDFYLVELTDPGETV